MFRRFILSILFFVTISNSLAAITPDGPYCFLQNYQIIVGYKGVYAGMPLERLVYVSDNDEYVKFNGTVYQTVENSTIVDIEMKEKLKHATWDQNNEHYCGFEDGNMCPLKTFYNKTCGIQYQREIPCGSDGQRINRELQQCCLDLEEVNTVDSTLCRIRPGFFVRLIESIKNFFRM